MTQILEHHRWANTRMILSGLFLLVLGTAYIAVITPLADFAVPADYRFPFSFESSIYTIFVLAYALHFVFRLVRPAGMKASAEGATVSSGQNAISAKIGMVLRTLFLLTVGGSYLTGAMIATPEIFSFAPQITGQSVVEFANFLHGTFAGLLITFGVLIILNEVVRVVRKEQTVKEWLFSTRYPEIKLLYWGIAILVIFQGILGLFLLGTISSIGPYGLIGLNTYSFETLVRHIHGPMGAVLISVFYGHLYLRIRPEYTFSW